MFVANQPRYTDTGPLARYRVFHTSDAAEARDRVAGIYCPHELRIAGPDRNRVDTSMSHLRVGNVSVNRLLYGPEVNIDVGYLGSFALVMMPMTGSAEVTCGDQRIRTSTATAAVISPTLPFFQTIEADCDQIMIQVDRDAIERTCAQHLGHDLRQPLQFAVDLDMSDHRTQGWPALVSYLLAMIDGDAVPLSAPLLATTLEHMVVATLLYTQPHNHSDELRQAPRSIAPSHVKRVEEFISDHAGEPLTVASLAAYAGVSASALYAGFRNFRQTTPMAHLRNVRLQKVHDDLRQAGSGSTITVTDVAFKWGFAHLSHFTAHYKRKFGELPSDTLRRLV
ncbi:MAG: AraC family transcriptional regulator [Rhodocyclaceae bacterium]|nr:AraC family transcriptional regulator [Rhodocyclaceae bacterium]